MKVTIPQLTAKCFSYAFQTRTPPPEPHTRPHELTKASAEYHHRNRTTVYTEPEPTRHTVVGGPVHPRGRVKLRETT